MPTTKVKTPKRMDMTAVEDDVLATAQGFTAALHRAGALDAVNMRDMDRLCLPHLQITETGDQADQAATQIPGRQGLGSVRGLAQTVRAQRRSTKRPLAFV